MNSLNLTYEEAIAWMEFFSTVHAMPYIKVDGSEAAIPFIVVELSASANKVTQFPGWEADPDRVSNYPNRLRMYESQTFLGTYTEQQWKEILQSNKPVNVRWQELVYLVMTEMKDPGKL